MTKGLEHNLTAGELAPDKAALERRLRRLSWILDNSVRLPGGFRIGVDAIIGLVPGIGDLAGAVLSGYIVVEATRLGVRGALLWRMILNIALEAILGAVPLLGDIFDMTFKANMRNMKLLERHLADPGATRVQDKAMLGFALFGILLVLAALAAGMLLIVGALWRALAG